MIAQVIIENGVKKIIPLTADAGAGNPVGTIIPMYKKSSPSGYLYCDGSTFDQNAYPLLYAYLGSNVLPDYDTSRQSGEPYSYIKATSGLSEGQQDNVVAQLKGLLKTVEYTGTTGGDGMLWGAFSGIDVTKVLSVLVKSDTGHNTSAIISNASSSPTAYGIRIVHFQNNSYTSEANKEVTVSITYLDY